MSFPSNPSNGDTHKIGSISWSWNGYAWDKQTAGISFDGGGITFADGTFQSTAASGSGGGGGVTELNGSTAGVTLAHGFRYKVSAVAASPSSPSAGEIAIKDLIGAGVIPSGFKIHKNPFNSVIDLSLNSGDSDGHFTKFADNGGIVTIINEKSGKSAYFANSDGANFTSSSNILEYTGNANSYDATSDIASVGDFVIVKLDFYTDAGVKSIGGPNFQNKGDLKLGAGLTTENAGGGIGRLVLDQTNFPIGITHSIGFMLDGNGSPITTGDKKDALRQMPFDSYIVKTSAYIPDGVNGDDNEISFGIKKTSSLSSSVRGITLEIGRTGSVDQSGFTFTGYDGATEYFRELTAVSDTIGSTVEAGQWIYPAVTGNSGDINKVQIFMTLRPT